MNESNELSKLSDYLLKKFENEPGNTGEYETPVDVAIRLLERLDKEQLVTHSTNGYLQNPKVYLEVLTGTIYTMLPYSEDSVYVSWINEPYHQQGQSITVSYFDYLVAERHWVEMKEEVPNV